MLHLEFLRHAESAFNSDPQNKQFDCPLTAVGRSQAAASLVGATTTHIIVSPLLRARQTLELLPIDRDVNVHVWACVREQRQDPCDFMAGEDSTALESDEALAYRVSVFWYRLQQLVVNAAGKEDVSVLVVAHNEWIAMAAGVSSLANATLHSMDVPLRVLRAFVVPGPWFVVDLDGVLLTNLRPELLPGTKETLRAMASAGPLCLCSYNHRARDILWQTQLLPLFTEILCGQPGPKATQIAALAERRGFELADCIFFDDTPEIIASCSAAGIRSLLVTREHSLSQLATPFFQQA